MEECFFCKLAHNIIDCHKIYEDEEHLAFLSIFPNVKGFTILIPKTHYKNYIVDLPDIITQKIMSSAKTVAKLLQEKLENVSRVSIILESGGIEHLHVKLFPMPKTNNIANIEPITAHIDKFFENYEGYISSHDFIRADDKYLEKLAKTITS